MRHPVRTVSTSICRRARRTLMQDEVSSADSVTNGRPIHNRNPEAGNPRQCWLWLGERSRAQQRKTAAERREVLRNGVVWRCSAHEATGRNRANTGAQGKKIPTDKGWDFGFWWWTLTTSSNHLDKHIQHAPKATKYIAFSVSEQLATLANLVDSVAVDHPPLLCSQHRCHGLPLASLSSPQALLSAA